MNKLETLQADVNNAETDELRAEKKLELNKLILKTRQIKDREIELSRDKLELIIDTNE